MIKKILILGASGFIGKGLAAQLDEKNIPWLGVCFKKRDDPKLLSINDYDDESLSALMSEYPVVINALGSAKPRDFEGDTVKVLESFLTVVNRVSRLIKNSKTEYFINISSAGTVYGENNGYPSVETDDLRPISWYGRAKCIEEVFYESTCAGISAKYLCVRVTNPYGRTGNVSHGVVDVLISSYKENKSFYSYSDLDPIRDYIFLPDLANGVISLMLEGRVGVYNIGSGQALKVSELISFVEKLEGKGLKRDYVISPKHDVKKNIVDTTKFNNVVAMSESQSVFEYLERMILS